MNVRLLFRDTVFTSVKRRTAPAEIKKYLARQSKPRLNLGSGGNRVPGWLNVDRFPPPRVTFLDATEPLPFDDATFEHVICEHMIEHIPKPDAIRLLGEIRRVTKPGGMVRIVTPDLDWFCKQILTPPAADAEDQQYIDLLKTLNGASTLSWCDAMNLCFYEHGHRYIWSIDELKSAMTTSGLHDAVVTRAGEPIHEVFKDVEGHPRLIGHLPNALEAFAVEAKV